MYYIANLSVQYQVFVQNIAEQKFVASVMGMPTVSEYGATEEEAVSRAKAALATQLAKGKLIDIELPQATLGTLAMGIEQTNESHSSSPMKYAGIFADDPSFDDWVEKLKLIRAEANAEADD